MMSTSTSTPANAPRAVLRTPRLKPVPITICGATALRALCGSTAVFAQKGQRTVYAAVFGS
jgi:hypothetical protein